MIIKIYRSITFRINNLINAIYIPLYFSLNGVKSSKSVKVYGKPYIKNFGSFTIEDNVVFNSSFTSNPIGIKTFCSFLINKGATLTIKKRAAISNISIACYSSISIGEDTFIGVDVMLYDTDFHSIDAKERIRGGEHDRSIISKPIDIGDRVFIGAGTTILKGVTIGDNSIVGAESVVTKNIPSNQIWAGNPAKFIRDI